VRRHHREVALDLRGIVKLVSSRVRAERSVCDAPHEELLLADEEKLSARARAYVREATAVMARIRYSIVHSVAESVRLPVPLHGNSEEVAQMADSAPVRIAPTRPPDCSRKLAFKRYPGITWRVTTP
jgi:hypothetical protein